MTTDAELIGSVRRGDHTAAVLLHDRHVRVAVSVARSQLNDATEAEAIVNEVFGRVIAIIERGGGPESAFRSYLVRAVRNECVDAMRARRVAPSRVADVAVALQADADFDGRLVDGWHGGSTHAAIDPSITVFDAMDGAVAMVALSMLSERSHEILTLMELEGLELTEAAARMGIDTGAAAALRYRAKEKLRQAYLVASVSMPATPVCHDCVVRLGAFVRGAAGPRHEARVVAHLELCRRCRSIEVDMRDLNAEIDRCRE